MEEGHASDRIAGGGPRKGRAKLLSSALAATSLGSAAFAAGGLGRGRARPSNPLSSFPSVGRHCLGTGSQSTPSSSSSQRPVDSRPTDCSNNNDNNNNYNNKNNNNNNNYNNNNNSSESAWAVGRRGTAAAAIAAFALSLNRRAARATGGKELSELEAALLLGVERSPLDRRSYQALTLENGLRVLLASDPEGDKAAAALDVHVGYFSDPSELPGLAHFCEHMLFLGTEAFPEENGFDTFLTASGGYSNAFTEEENTCFFFACQTAALSGALQRFGSFFQTPLLTASAAEREVNAINSEHLKNLQDDGFRLNQVNSSRANPAHPFHHFGTGTRATLLEGSARQGIDLRAALLSYYQRFYRAPLMTLCIVGREPLAELASYAKNFFGGVPGLDPTLGGAANAKPSAAWAGVPAFLPKAFETGVDVVPIADERILQVTFPLSFAPESPELVTAARPPPAPEGGGVTREAWRYYDPTAHVSSALGHEGPRSLCALLRRKGWITGLGVGVADENSSFAVLSVSLELTADGLLHRAEALELLFGYLKLLRSKTAWPQELLAENLKLSEANWVTSEQLRAGDAVVRHAQSMQRWGLPRDYVSGGSRLRGGPGLQGTVAALMGCLTPGNALVTTASRSFEATADETEPWYGTRLKSRSMAAERRSWEGAKAAPGLDFPSPNPFLPRSLELKAPRTPPLARGAAPAPPQERRKDDRWRVLFKQDTEFGVPKAYAFIELITPLPRSSASAAICSSLYDALVQDALTESLLYDAHVAGLFFQLSTSARGAQLFFGGFDDRLEDFARAAMDGVLSFDPAADITRFDAQRDVLARDLESTASEKPYQQATYWSQLATTVPDFSVQELQAALRAIRPQDVAAYARKLWREERLFGVAMCQGNLRPEEADGLVKVVEGKLRFEALPEAEWPVPKIVQVPVCPTGPGMLLVHDAMDPKEENSAVELNFQAGSAAACDGEAGRKLWATLQVLIALLRDPFYSELRTKQQLGYIVSCQADRREGVARLVFVVQGAALGPVEVLGRVDAFLKEVAPPLLDAKSEAEFSTLVGALAESRLSRPQQLLEAADRAWTEVRSREFRFARAPEDAAALRKVSRAEVREAFARFVAPGGKERRRLVSVVYGSLHSSQRVAATAALEAAGGEVIPDPAAFSAANTKWPRTPGQM